MKFSDFSKTKVDQKADAKREEKVEKADEIDQSKVEDMVNKYSEYSSDELLNEFLKVGKTEKEKGTLNDEKINNIKEVLSPYLNGEQKKYFDELIKKL